MADPVPSPAPPPPPFTLPLRRGLGEAPSGRPEGAPGEADPQPPTPEEIETRGWCRISCPLGDLVLVLRREALFSAREANPGIPLFSPPEIEKLATSVAAAGPTGPALLAATFQAKQSFGGRLLIHDVPDFPLTPGGVEVQHARVSTPRVLSQSTKHPTSGARGTPLPHAQDGPRAPDFTPDPDQESEGDPS